MPPRAAARGHERDERGPRAARHDSDGHLVARGEVVTRARRGQVLIDLAEQVGDAGERTVASVGEECGERPYRRDGDERRQQRPRLGERTAVPRVQARRAQQQHAREESDQSCREAVPRRGIPRVEREDGEDGHTDEPHATAPERGSLRGGEHDGGTDRDQGVCDGRRRRLEGPKPGDGPQRRLRCHTHGDGDPPEPDQGDQGAPRTEDRLRRGEEREREGDGDECADDGRWRDECGEERPPLTVLQHLLYAGRDGDAGDALDAATQHADDEAQGGEAEGDRVAAHPGCGEARRGRRRSPACTGAGIVSYDTRFRVHRS